MHEMFCLDSFHKELFFWDDFLGDQLKDEWREAGVGSAAVIDAQTGGIVRITTGAITNDAYYIDWGDIRSLHVDKRVSMEVRVKLNQIVWARPELRLIFDGNNFIAFDGFNDAGVENWAIQCRDDGPITAFDSGVALDTNYHIYRIECHIHGGSHVHFYIDGVETDNSPINTNIPDDAGDYLQPYIYQLAREDVAKSMDIDYVGVRQDV